jgi:hypothetical protein
MAKKKSCNSKCSKKTCSSKKPCIKSKAKEPVAEIPHNSKTGYFLGIIKKVFNIGK